MKIVKMDKKIEKEQNRELEQFCRQIRESGPYVHIHRTVPV